MAPAHERCDVKRSGCLEAWLRPGRGKDDVAAKRQRAFPPNTSHTGMHGVCISDHSEKVTWSGYWDERQKKLESQPVDVQLFGAVTSSLVENKAGGAVAVQANLFRNCCIYFDGRVDVGGGFSAYSLSKVARLHGATVSPRLTKRQVTHVVCTQLSGAKERHALTDATSSLACVQYIVHPSWITDSVAAGRRLAERSFSLMSQISQGFGLNTLSPKQGGAKRIAGQIEKIDLEGDLVIVSDSPGCTDNSMPVPATALDSEDETQTEIDSSDSNADGE